MGHEDAGSMSECWDQLHHIPHQMFRMIVLLLGGAVCIPITPGGGREGGRGKREGGNEGVRRRGGREGQRREGYIGEGRRGGREGEKEEGRE